MDRCRLAALLVLSASGEEEGRESGFAGVELLPEVKSFLNQNTKET